MLETLLHIKARLRDYFLWLKRISNDFERNRSSLVAGGLSFFVALALAPTAVALGSLAGLLIDPTELGETLADIANDTPAAADHAEATVNALVSLAENASASSFTATSIISILIAVYASSKVVLGLRRALNTTFRVKEIRFGLVDRGVSAVATFLGLLFAVSAVVLLAVIPRVFDWLRIDTFSFTVGNAIVGWTLFALVTYVSVRVIYSHVPAERQHVPWLSRGVTVATLWIVTVTGGLGLYAKYSASFNAAVLVFGTAVVLLLWLYFCFLGLLWGATVEANQRRAHGG